MKNLIRGLYVAIAVVLLLAVVIYPIWNRFVSQGEVTMTVTSTDRVKDKWMVLGVNADGESVALENSDSLTHLKFNSSDLQAGIQVGKTYTFRTAGIRNPLFSMYPNILSVVPTSDTTE